MRSNYVRRRRENYPGKLNNPSQMSCSSSFLDGRHVRETPCVQKLAVSALDVYPKGSKDYRL